MTETGRFLRGHATRLRWKLIKAAENNESIVLPTATGGREYLSSEQVKNELNSRKWTIPVNRRAFGVEFELISPVVAQELFRLLTEAKVKVLNLNGYGHSANRTHWEIKTDSSLRPGRQGGRGYEIVSPILRGKRGENEIRKVLKVLNDAGCYVNLTTGTHVHIQATDLNVEGVRNVALTYNNAGNALDLLFSPSRRGIRNQYCQPLTATETLIIRQAQNLSGIRGNKYRKINVTTYPRLGTLEFRQHQGTLNAAKIISWIQFTKRLVQSGGRVADLPTVASLTPDVESTLRNLFSVIKLESEPTRLLMNRYYANRAA